MGLGFLSMSFLSCIRYWETWQYGSFFSQDSEDDEYEETEEEFLNRYAEAALALENGTGIEEGDIEDEDREMDFEQGSSFVLAVHFAFKIASGNYC